MGFRTDPLTTAEGVDTGETPTGPGARVYQDNSGEWPRGVVEFRPGIFGADPATLALTSYVYFDPIDGGLFTYGNELALTSCRVDSLEAARLVMAEEDDGTGSFRTVVRLTAPGGLSINGSDLNWQPAILGNGWSIVTPAPPFVGARYIKHANRQVELQFLIKGGTVGVNVAAFRLPVGYRPERQLIEDALAGGNTIGRVDVMPDGAVCCVVGSNASFSANFSFRADQ